MARRPCMCEATTYCHAFNRCCRNAVSVGLRNHQCVQDPGGADTDSLAGLRLFFLSLDLDPESCEAIESV